MKARKLGGAGLEVPAPGLGCMGMSWAYGKSLSQTEADVLVHRALDLGIRFFDTAEVYGPFTNEELLGHALAGRRESAVVATKVGFVVEDGKIRGTDSRPERIRAALDGSLRRLRTDYVDLLYQHRVDPQVPVEEVMGEMSRLVAAGKVHCIGLSEASPRTIRRAHAVHPLCAVQSEYSLWERGVESEVLPVLRELGIGLVAFAPLGRGFMTGAIRSADALARRDYRRLDPRFQDGNIERNLALVEALAGRADALGAPVARLALAWVLARGEDVVPIAGTTTPSHLEDNALACELSLGDRELQALDALFPPGVASGERYPESMMRWLDRG